MARKNSKGKKAIDIEVALRTAAERMMSYIDDTEAASEPLDVLLEALGALPPYPTGDADPEDADPDDPANEAVFLKRCAIVEQAYGRVRDHLLASGALVNSMRSAVELVATAQPEEIQTSSLRNPGQLRAIRRFFTHPKGRYTVAELHAIYGAFLPDIEEAMDLKDGEMPTRARAAGFLKSYVSPVVVGQALADFTTPLKLQVVTVELPAWMIEGLSDCAKKTGTTFSDVVASEILWGVEDGISTDFSDAISGRVPDYATVGGVR